MKIEEWFRILQEHGCIICVKEGRGKSPSDMHHILKAGRRVDDFHTIPLCFYHHRSGENNLDYVSRHPWRREFEKRYGTEWDLFRQLIDSLVHAKLLRDLDALPSQISLD